MQINYVKKDSFKFGNLRGLSALIRKETRRFLVVWLQTIMAPVVTTLIFYLIFALAFGGDHRQIGDVPFLEFLAPGLIIMAMVQNAFANTSSSLIISKIQGNITDILLPPFSATELYLGHVIGALTRGVLVGFCTYVAMLLFLPLSPESLITVIVFAILGNFMLGSLGILAGVWADKFDQIAVVTNFVVTPLAFLSGTFYSMSSLPEIWQFIASFNPFYYMIDGFRQGMIGVGDTNIMFGASLLLAVNVLLAVTIMLMLRAGYKIKA